MANQTVAPPYNPPEFNDCIPTGDCFTYTTLLRQFRHIDSPDDRIEWDAILDSMVNLHLFGMLALYLAGQPHHEPPYSDDIVDRYRITIRECADAEKYAHSVLAGLPHTWDDLSDYLRMYVSCQEAVRLLCEMFGDNMAEKFSAAVGGFQRSVDR